MHNLEKLDEILEIEKIQAAVLKFSVSDIGKDLILSSRPLRENKLLERINLSFEVYALNKKGDALPLSSSSRLIDYINLAKRDGMIPLEAWTYIANDLEISRELIIFLKDYRRSEHVLLREYLKELKDTKHLLTNIYDVFDNAFCIKDDASYELKSIRQSLLRKEKEMSTRVNTIVNEYKDYLREARYYLRGGVFALPVIRDFKNKVPGLLVDISDTEQTVFIHPLALVNLQNEIEELKQREKHEIEKILLELSQIIKPNGDDIIKNNNIIGYFDLLQSLSKYAIVNKGSFINLSKEQKIHLHNARHPLIDSRKVIANTFILDDVEGRILILSGPNAGGKTVALKTIGLLTYLFLMGYPIHADSNSSISYFSELLIDIGDSQSINLDLSTFSGHMKSLAEILDKADSRSLVLIDELGIGTEPRTGEAIALASLDYFGTINSFTVISSHYQSLKALGLSNKNMSVGSFAFDLEKNLPRYNFLKGIPGQSYGIELAKRMKVLDVVLNKAREILDENSDYANFEEVNQRNLDLLESIKEKEKQVVELKESLVREKDLVEKERKKLVVLKDEFEREYEERLIERIHDASATFDDLIKKAYQNSEKPHEVINVRKEFEALVEKTEIEDAKKVSDPITVGDYAIIEDIGIHGSVKEINKNKATVITNDGLSFEVNIHRLRRTEKPLIARTTGQRLDNDVLKGPTPFELNVLGYRVEEAVTEVDNFLDRAFARNVKRVTIIHGYGTGALKKGIREHLTKSHYVKSIEDGPITSGGGGQTVVNLK